jgi:hypothetical protein
MYTFLSAIWLAAVTCPLLLGCGGEPLKPPVAPEAAHSRPGGNAASALADAARALAGTWACTGSVYGADGAPSPSQASLTVALELDDAWLRTELAVLSGEHRYKFRAYRTFDTVSNEWVNVIVDNLRGHARSSSADGVTWQGESSGPMGTMTIKDSEILASPGEVDIVGQYSLDGRSWRTGYDLSCTK